jgi:hypothetical protein
MTWSGWVVRAWRRLGGQSRCRLTALTIMANGSNVEGRFEEVEDKESVIRMNECTAWLGRRMPSVHKSTQMKGK